MLPADAAGTLYGYTVDGGFIVGRGGHDTARIAIRHSDYARVSITPDNGHLFTLASPAGTDSKAYDRNTIFGFDTKTGAPTTPILCGCNRVTPLEDSAVIWMTDDHTIMRADLAAPQQAPTAWRAVDVPAPPEPVSDPQRLSGPRVLAATPHHILLGRMIYSMGYAVETYLYLLDDDGTVRQLGQFHSNAGVEAAPSPDGRTFALLSDAHVSNGCRTGEFGSLDTGTGTIHMDKPFPDEGADDEHCSDLSRPRWSTDGLTLTACRWTLADIKGGSTGCTSTRWRYSNSTWTQAAPQALVDTVALDSGNALQLGSGGLEFVTPNGSRQKIAAGVLSIDAPAAS